MSARGLRYQSTATMPASMRAAVERAIQKAERIQAVPQLTEKADTKRKYKNQPTTVDGFRFDSKKEARRYEVLKLLREAGRVEWFTWHVPFCLPGNIRYYADFVVKWADGSVTVEDTKSPVTRTNPVYVNKRKQMKACHGIEIQEL